MMMMYIIMGLRKMSMRWSIECVMTLKVQFQTFRLNNYKYVELIYIIFMRITATTAELTP